MRNASEEFLLGNRSLNYIATAIVAHSSDMSLWLFMGFPGEVYSIGTLALWVPMGLLVGMYATWNLIAERLRIETEYYNSVTLSDYLTKKFNDPSGMIRCFSSIAAIFFFIFYIASGLVGIGIMFENVFAINYVIGIGVGLLTTIFYTYFGGFMGIAWCHLIQGIFLVFMIFFVPLYAYTFLANGWNDITTIATFKQISLNIIPRNFNELSAGLIAALSWGLAVKSRLLDKRRLS
jgi:sodium/proline symporter